MILTAPADVSALPVGTRLVSAPTSGGARLEVVAVRHPDGWHVTGMPEPVGDKTLFDFAHGWEQQ